MNNASRILAVVTFGLGAAHWLHAEPFAYVAHSGGVSVIDVASHRVSAEIPLPSAPREGVAARPGDSRVYVAAGQSVFAIDSRAQAVVATIPEFAAEVLALNPARPEVYVANAPDLELLPGDRLVAINTETNTHAGTISADVQPFRMAVSGDGTRLYALRGQQIVIFDTATRRMLTAVAAPLAESFALHPTLNRAFVSVSETTTETAKVDVIDLDTGNVLSTIATPSTPVDLVVDPSGNRLFVTYRGGSSVSVIDVPNARIVASLPVGAITKGIDITPDGGQVFVVNAADSTVSVIDAIGLRVIDTIRVGNLPRAIGRFIGGVGATASPPDVLTGLWWNPAEPGWGVHVAQRGSKIFAAWFTYNASGGSKWYVSSDCTLNGLPPPPIFTSQVSCSGNIYETTGPRFFSDPFNPGAVATTKDGFFQMVFDDQDSGSMSFGIGSTVKTMPLKRQIFRTSGPSFSTDYTDLWWNPTESGWGIGITQQHGTMFLAWFAYDDSGSPTWLVASNCVMNANGDGCSGELYRTSGPIDPLRNAFDPSTVRATTVGNITASFSDANTGTLSYTVDGKSGSKQITRQLF